MERAKSVIEDARTRMAVLVAAGAMVLGAAGCTTAPDNEKARQSATAATQAAAPHFDVQPGADQLPLTSRYPNKNPADTVIDTGYLNAAVESQPKEDERSVYDVLLNFDDKSEKSGDSLPGGKSAPVLDFMLNSQGKLVYKDYAPVDGTSQEDKKIISYVNQKKDIIEPAMRAGDIGTIHFRVGKPVEADDITEAKTQAQHVHADYNDNGQPSLYFQMEGGSEIDGAVLNLGLGHEAEHALLGQADKDAYTEEDKALLNEACAVLRDNALTTIQKQGHDIVGHLRTAQSNMKAAYRPAMQQVIDAVENNTYAKIPVEDADGMPNCFVQSPRDAYFQVARSMGLEKVGDPGKTEASGLAFEKAMDDVREAWDETAKQSVVYKALDESINLPPSNENKKWSHAYKNPNELTATVANFVEDDPATFGKNVAGLDYKYQQSILKTAERDVRQLLRLHQNEPDYQKHMGNQYDVFLAAANVAR